ncbi:LacI family DNA-binding transcriptional regulator [Vagococcus vulneris]|nr:LacI family DNA-binding transcriptional regulator [Vagococcus vulneris]
MNDVARLAGVSRGSVSNYINGVKVKESTRIKVEAAIKELNYVPNMAGRFLKTQKSDIVVFILPTIWNPFFSELAFYLEKELRNHQLKMILCNSEDDYRQEMEYINMAKEQKVQGIITISYSDISPYITSDIPIVSIERYFNNKIPYVTSNNFQGGELAADVLHRLGAKRLLMVGRDIENNLGVIERLNGFKSFCLKYNLSFGTFVERSDSEDFKKNLKKEIQKIYSQSVKYDGIFAATDRYAQYCINSLSELGIQIPKDVQIIGFDGAKNFKNEEQLVSSIRQPVKQIAEISVKELLQLPRTKEQIQKKHILPVTFTEGITTKRES